MSNMTLRADGPMDRFVRHLDRPVHPVVAPRRRLVLFPDGRTIEGLAVSPDGTRLAVVGEDMVSIIDTATGNRVTDYLRVFDGSLLSLRFSPDGRHLVLGLTGDRVLVLDALSGGIISLETIPVGRLASATMTTDGALLVAARGYEGVYLWRWSSSGSWGQEPLPPVTAEEVSITSDGHLVVAEPEGRVAVHNLTAGEVREVWPTDGKTRGRLWGLTDLMQVLGGDVTHLVRLSDGHTVFFSWPNRAVSAAALTPDGNWIYLSFLREGGTVYQYPVTGWQGLYLALSGKVRTTLLIWADTSWRALVTATEHLRMMPDVLLAEHGEGLVALTPGVGGEHRLAVSWGEALEDDGWQWEISRITDMYGNTGSPLHEGQEAAFPDVVRAIVGVLVRP